MGESEKATFNEFDLLSPDDNENDKFEKYTKFNVNLFKAISSIRERFGRRDTDPRVRAGNSSSRVQGHGVECARRHADDYREQERG